MIVVMEPGASRAAVEAVEARIRAAGHGVHVSRGAERTIVGAIRPKTNCDTSCDKDRYERRRCADGRSCSATWATRGMDREAS